MGSPLDVLIKQFRATSCNEEFDSPQDCAKAFFQYLSCDWNHSDDLQNAHARQILFPLYSDVMEEFDSILRKLVQKDAKYRSRRPLLPILITCVEERICEYEKSPVSSCFSDVTESDLGFKYYSLIDQIISQAFREPPLDDDQRSVCRRLGILALHREVFSDVFTGFVFAGFGKSETFPSLFSYYSDGIIGGKLKMKLNEQVIMGRQELAAKIIPFAQREVVDRFLVGIDPELEDGIDNYLQNVLSVTKSKLFSGVGRISTKNKAAISKNIDASLGAMVADFKCKWLEKIKNSYSKETEDMVLFMAKQESSHLAESLVNITSLKRKYSPDEESVGGPVDVAVISKNDGFVWAKRKHYFPAELNPRYFTRKFGNVQIRKGDIGDAKKVD